MRGGKKTAAGVFLVLAFLLLASAPGVRAQVCPKAALSEDETAEALFAKLRCHVLRNQHTEAEAVLRVLKKKLTPVRDYLLYYEARTAVGLDRGDAAAELLREILALHPDSPVARRARETLGGLLLESENYPEAEKVYSLLSRVTESRWKKALYLKKLGEAKEIQGLFPQAAAVFVRIWEEHPEVSFSGYAFRLHKKNGKVFAPSPAQYEKRGNALFAAGAWRKALFAFSKSPRTVPVRMKRGICLYRLSRYAEALAAFSGIGAPEAVYWKGKTLARMKKEEEAVSVFESLGKLRPESRWAAKSLLDAANIRRDREEEEEAERLYRLVIRRYPAGEEASESTWKLGWMLYRNGRFREAASVLYPLPPARGVSAERRLYWYARAAEKAGDKPGALFGFRKLADSPKITYYSLLSRIRLGKPVVPPEKTASFRTRAGNPFGKEPAVARFGFFEKAGTPDLALREAKILRSRANTDARRLYLSSLYRRAGDYKTSISLVQELVSPEALRLAFPRAYAREVRLFSKKYNLDEFLVYSLIREESRFQKDAVSSSDARGLMQLLPATAAETARKAKLRNYTTRRLFSPGVNVQLGCYYLDWLLGLFEGNVAASLAGYNGGPTNARRWIRESGSLDTDEFVEEVDFRQSRNYVKKIFRSYGAYEAAYGKEKSQAAKESFEKFLSILSP